MVESLDVRVGSETACVSRSGEGEPLVYLHGAFGYGGWPPLLARLADDHTVYAPLHPGFGEGDGLEKIDDILDLVLYHFDLLDALGLEAPHVMGHFFGAMIAAEMASIRPERVGKLVLASPAGLWLDDDPGADYFATPSDELRALLFHDPDSDIARESMPDPDSDEERARMGIERARALSTVAKFLWPIPDKGLRKRLHRIRSETLIIVADGDRVVPPSHGAEMASLVPSSTLHTLEGAGHVLHLERPNEVARLVSDFLAAR